MAKEYKHAPFSKDKYIKMPIFLFKRSKIPYLMSNMLLFCWSVALRVNQGRMGHQIASVLHDKTPTHT